MAKSSPRIRDVLSHSKEEDQKVEVLEGQYLYWTDRDGTQIKVEMIDGELYIWNQGNTQFFGLSIVPVSSNVVKVLPTRD